ncbi:MAG: carboxypeptidase regulatory-like domain-containing protein, partial [Acidimicrobiales bacterium]|nr:carboxypeptidase regulatory-like domain-containing protein [Acidimicrobiales bacterium]
MRDRSQVPVPAAAKRTRTTFGTLAGFLAIGVALVGGLLTLLASPASAAGTVSGTVTDTGANPIPAIDVFVLDPVWGSTIAQTTTDGNGDYSVPVAAGTYRMLFRDPGTTYADRFSGDAATFAASSTITVPESGTHIEDVTMVELGAVFSGTITDAGAN